MNYASSRIPKSRFSQEWEQTEFTDQGVYIRYSQYPPNLSAEEYPKQFEKGSGWKNYVKYVLDEIRKKIEEEIADLYNSTGKQGSSGPEKVTLFTMVSRTR